MLHEQIAEDLRRIAINMGTSPVITGRLLPGDRRAVAVLFLDISGFSAMAEKMDFELVHVLVNGVMQTLSGIVSATGGYVDKLEGDRIMALFGARTAGENDSVRAVDCAVRMLDAITQVNGMLADEDIEIGARVGVAFGQVIVAPDASGHLTATGDVVNVASRLESLAPVGSVMVSGDIRRECGDAFHWEDLGERSIRGRTAPVHVFAPSGPGKLRRERWERAARISSTPLLGRDGEMNALRSAWRSSRPGSPGAVEVRGEAGIGKSRLLHEFTRKIAAEEADTLVISGRSVASVQPPLGLWSTLLQDAIARYGPDRDSPEALLECLAGRSGGGADRELPRILPFLNEILSSRTEASGMSEESRLKEMMTALGKLLEAFGRAGDLIVVLEDLHWMDRASREVLEFLLTWLRPANRTLFLLSYRPCPSVEIRLYPPFRLEMDLTPLAGEDGALIISHMLGGSVPPELEAMILARAGGNPFFIEELVLNMIESGRILETPDGWEASGEPGDMHLPPSVRAILTARIDRLSRNLRELLQIAAVLGSRFSGRILGRLSLISGDGSGDISVLLDELAGRGFLRQAGIEGEYDWAFYHALVRDAAYEMLLLQNRTVLHRMAAEVLEEESGDRGDMAVVIADHWSRAGDLGKAIEWGERALAHCRLNYLNAEGVEIADRLLDWIGRQPGSSFRDNSLFEVLMRKESFLERLGRRDEQEELLKRLQKTAEEKGRRDWAVKVNGSIGRMLTFTGRLDRAREVLLPALEASREFGDRELTGRLLADAAALCIRQGMPDESVSLAREAVETFRGSGEKNSECAAMNSLGAAYWNMGRMTEALECFREANRLSRETSNRWFEGNTLLNMGVIHRCMGSHCEARKLYRAALELNRETGNMQSEANAHANLGILHLLEDRTEEAGEHYQAALAIYRRTGDSLQEQQILAKLGRLAMKTGNWSEAEALLRESIAMREQTGRNRDEGETLNSLAELLMLTGRLEEAGECLELAMASARQNSCTPDLVNSLCMLAELALGRGDPGRAGELCAEARSLCGDLESDDESFRRLQELIGRLDAEGDQPPADA